MTIQRQRPQRRLASDLSDDELQGHGSEPDQVPFASPVFDGATEEIGNMLQLAYPTTWAKLPAKGLTATRTQAQLYDGRTGDPFERTTTIGYMHYLKLHHLVDDKMHARSTGRITAWSRSSPGWQGAVWRPALFEMEVWALEAYGASYTFCRKC